MNTKTIHSGKFLDFIHIEHTLENGKKKIWEAANRTGTGEIVGALVENKEKETFVLVEQFRHPVNSRVLELVAGIVDEGNTREEAIAKEILEETGYIAQNIDFLLKGPKSPGMTNEFTYDYYAIVKGEKGKQFLEESEQGLEVIEVKNSVYELLKFCNKKEKEGVLISPGIWASIGKSLTLGKIKLN